LLAMGMLMLSFWLKENAPGRRRIVIIGLVMLLTAVVLNQLGQALIPVKRASPTLTFTNINRVSELLSVPTKDASRDSFPGDHGMML
nr:Kdo(2)-lipid A phosphotransferase [Lactobacillus gasseri]